MFTDSEKSLVLGLLSQLRLDLLPSFEEFEEFFDPRVSVSFGVWS